MKKLLIGAALIASSLGTAHAGTKQIILTPANVTGSTGDYSAQFAAGNIFDNQTGPVTEPVQAGYWLNPDNGNPAAALTIDLGAAIRLYSFTLFNTHNAQYNDRGTGNFSITGSNDGVNFTTITSGKLNPESSSNATLTGQTFLAGGTFRYLQFLPTSVATSPDGVHTSPCCGDNVYGLNELRVTSTVPEPAIWGMMIMGFGLVGAAMRRRSTKIAFA